MRRSMSLSCLVVLTLVACDQGASTLLIPFGGRTAIGSGNQSLQVVPSAAQIPVGQLAQLQTNAPLSLLNQVQWRSSNPNIAAVNATGGVTGIFPGIATITARFAFDTTQAATATVTVLGVVTP